MQKTIQSSLKKATLLSRFNKRSIRDLKSLLEDYLYILGINLNLRKDSHIDFASSLMDYKPYPDLKAYDFNKGELQNYLINLTTKIDSLLNENGYMNGKSENYFTSCPLIIDGNIYLSIKIYDSAKLINSKLFLLTEINKNIYSINSRRIHPELLTPLKSKNAETIYKRYLMDLDDDKETFSIKKQEKLPTYPFFYASLQEIEPLITLGIIGCYNNLLTEMGEDRFLNKIPHKPCISLKPDFQEESDFYSTRWIKPQITTIKKEFKKYNNKKIDILSNLKYTYNSPNRIEHWDWINIYY